MEYHKFKMELTIVADNKLDALETFNKALDRVMDDLAVETVKRIL